MYLDICNSSGTLSTILMFKNVITIMKIIIPLILIIISGYDLFNTVIELKNDVYKKILKRLIALVCIFFIPTVLSLFLDILGTTNLFNSSCWTNANASTIAVIRHQEKIEAQAEEAARKAENKRAEQARKKVDEAREEARRENEKKNEEEKRKIEQKQQQGILTPGKSGTLNGHTIDLAAGNSRIYFLDVVKRRNDGGVTGSDAIVLESNGKFALIDAGIPEYQSRVLQYLKDIGATNLEFALITHAHGDHFGGYNYLINNGIKVNKLYIKKLNHNKIKNIIDNSKSKGVTVFDVSTGKYSTETLGEFNFKFYNTDFQDRSISENMNSIVTLATVNNKKIYLSADLGGDLNYRNSRKAYNLEIKYAKIIGKVDFYKASHHGLDSNNPAEALRVLNPSYGVVTALKEKPLTSNARKRMFNNTGITKETLYYTGNGTVILTIQPSGEFVIQQLGAD